ncbi:MAG: hypothetical protein JXQ73_11370 [Phycisphaerae bacterium]|nr:hypothetical protein [Phycisphaerae bacterium]
MSIFLDDQPFEVDVPTSATVGQVLETVLNDVRARHRVVAAIRCDGAEVDAENIQQVLTTPVDSYARVDFVSGTAGELAVDALSQVQAALGELQINRQQAVEKLNQGQISEAMELLGPFFEAWRRAHEAVLQSAKLIDFDLTAVTVDDVNVSQVFGDFAEQLRQIKEGLEASDHVTVADILSYEADKTSRRWTQLIEIVKQAAQDR